MPLDSNQFDTTFVVDSGDVYKVRCWGGGELKAEITLSADLTTSVENAVNEEISLMPNPVSDFLHIEFRGEKEHKIELINMKGQVLKETVTNSSFDWNMSDTKNGMYFIRVCKGENCVLEKIIKVE